MDYAAQARLWVAIVERRRIARMRWTQSGQRLPDVQEEE